MSHAVVITRTTTTTTSTSHVVLNTGYLRTTPGLLKLAQLIIGAVNVGLVSWHYRTYYAANPQVFFLLMAVAFLIGTFCLLASCLVSLSTGGIISKTIYELVYHTIAFLLYLIASIILLVDVTNGRYHSNLKDAYMAASILGIIVSALYLFSALIAQRSYRGF
uniref:Putative conserved plasma membrane protein n=1 Tax=Culex tarsalis TaxID=7177 RepID=A0A1Q3FNJ1_CULTA